MHPSILELIVEIYVKMDSQDQTVPVRFFTGYGTRYRYDDFVQLLHNNSCSVYLTWYRLSVVALPALVEERNILSSSE